MIVVWTQGAQEDPDAIFEYIAEDSGSAAERVTERHFSTAQSLSTFPLRGRLRSGTELREPLIQSTPYIVRYTVEGEHVIIASVRHGAQLLIH